jgi:WD40 repeat protein
MRHRGACGAVAFSPDGKTLASGGNEGSIILRDVKSLEPIMPPLFGDGAISALGFSPDGRTLASGAHDNTVRIWDVATGTQLLDLHDHGGIVRQVCFSPDGMTLATCSYVGDTVCQVFLWHARLPDSANRRRVACLSQKRLGARTVPTAKMSARG